MFQFDLGSLLRDKVSEFEGIATSRIEYLNGCIQYCLDGKIDKDGKRPKGEWIDEGQLTELVSAEQMKVDVVKSGTGGGVREHPPT